VAPLVSDSEIRSPTVGRWIPRVGLGTLLRPGRLVGHLLRAGRRLEIRIPKGLVGYALSVAAPGSWVEYGAVLVATHRLPVDRGLRATDEPTLADGLVAVRAPTDGSIFLCPEPEAEPFVEEGSEVKARDTLALIDVMKTFAPVRSPVAGVVERIVVTDGASVASGATLIWVRTATESDEVKPGPDRRCRTMGRSVVRR